MELPVCRGAVASGSRKENYTGQETGLSLKHRSATFVMGVS